MQTVIFVCTGNTCRSPMAEAIAQSLAGDREPFLAVSAGVAAMPGMPPSPETIRALQERGIHHDGRSKRLTAEMIREASAVLCMTRSHAEAARELVADQPDAEELRGSIHTLVADDDIPDPIGQSQEVYDALATRLIRIIPGRLNDVLRTPHASS